MAMDQGASVDIESGLPGEAGRVSQKAREEKRVNRMISTYQALVNDLAGDGGAVLKEVATLYINRVDELILNDPECRGYQAIFDKLKVVINVGKTIVAAKSKEVEEAQE